MGVNLPGTPWDDPDGSLNAPREKSLEARIHALIEQVERLEHIRDQKIKRLERVAEIAEIVLDWYDNGPGDYGPLEIALGDIVDVRLRSALSDKGEEGED